MAHTGGASATTLTDGQRGPTLRISVRIPVTLKLLQQKNHEWLTTKKKNLKNARTYSNICWPFLRHSLFLVQDRRQLAFSANCYPRNFGILRSTTQPFLGRLTFRQSPRMNINARNNLQSFPCRSERRLYNFISECNRNITNPFNFMIGVITMGAGLNGSGAAAASSQGMTAIPNYKFCYGKSVGV